MPAPSAVRPFVAGDAVRLVEIDGDPIPVADQLRAVVVQIPGETFDAGGFVLSELHVSFPTRDGRGGFDFWPADECVLDVDSAPIVPFV